MFFRDFTRHALLLPGAIAIAGLSLVACGDDDGGSGNGSDEDYVATVCGAMVTFGEEVEDVLADLDPNDTAASIDAFGEVFANLIDDLEDANPPSDVEDAHNQLLASFRDAQDAFEEDGLEAFETFQVEDIQLEPDVEERLAAVAAETEECDSAEGLFE